MSFFFETFWAYVLAFYIDIMACVCLDKIYKEWNVLYFHCGMKKIMGLLLGALMLWTSVYAGSEYFDAGQKLFDAGVTTLSPYYTTYDAGLQRFEAALLIKRFAEKILDKTPGAGVWCDYVDNRQLGSSNSIEISAACALGLFKGGQYFNPYNSFTRGQLIIVLARLLSNDPSKELDSAYNYLLWQSVITIDDRAYASRVSPRSELYIMLGRIMVDNPSTQQTNDISEQIQNIIDTVDDTTQNDQSNFDTLPDHSMDNNQTNNTTNNNSDIYPDLIISDINVDVLYNQPNNSFWNKGNMNVVNLDVTIKNNSAVDVIVNNPDGANTTIWFSCQWPQSGDPMSNVWASQQIQKDDNGTHWVYLIHAHESIILTWNLASFFPNDFTQAQWTKTITCSVWSNIWQEDQANNSMQKTFEITSTSDFRPGQ